MLAERYALRTRLGAGGMGAVYLARDLRLERDVAVKVILGATSSGETPVESSLFARFVREARAVATLGHPAIVTVFDAGFDGEMPYIVMERLKGESLAERIARGPLDPSLVTRIAARVLEGLSAAHAAGLVHRDIKPANIFLCQRDDGVEHAGLEDSVKILDFGVAGVSRDGRATVSSAEHRLTAAGLGVGTPMYMPPEQLRGEAPDARADLYALGASMYECLAGQPLFEAKTIAELCAKKLTSEPLPLERLAPHVSPALCAVIQRALERDPSQRFRDAASMRRALLEAMTIEAEPARERASSAVLSSTARPASVVGASATGVNATPNAFELPEQKALPGRAKRWWPLAVGVLLGVSLFATVRSFSRGPTRAVATRSVGSIAYGLHRRLERDAGVVLPVQPVFGLRTLAQFHDSAGSARTLLLAPDLWESCASDFQRSIDAAGNAAPPRWLAAQRLARGRARVLRGLVDEGLLDLREATRLDPDWAAAHVALADALARKREIEGAVLAAHRAEQLEPQWWVPLATLSGALNHGERWEESVQALQRARALAPNEPAILDMLALTMHGRGMDSEADTYAARALALDPDMLWSHLIRAERALERRDGEAALAAANRVIALSSTMAAGHLARGEALLLLRRRDEARESLTRGLSLARELGQMGISAQRVAQVEATLARLPRAQATGTSRTPRTDLPTRPRTINTPAGRTQGADQSSGNNAL